MPIRTNSTIDISLADHICNLKDPFTSLIFKRNQELIQASFKNRQGIVAEKAEEDVPCFMERQVYIMYHAGKYRPAFNQCRFGKKDNVQ